MQHFIISYDLHRQRTYEPVWEMLEGWGAVRLLESLWVVTTSKGGAGEIRTALQAVIDNDDSLTVIELKAGSQWSAIRAKLAGTAWLSANIRTY